MPPLEVADLIDRAVLLEATGYNRHGRLKVSDQPAEIACRWVEDVTSAGGGDVDLTTVSAQVYVDRDVAIGSILWHGKLKDFPRDWEADGGVVEVSNFHKVPDIRGLSFRRWCDVVRYRDELPDQE